MDNEITETYIYDLLNQVPDPEIPVISIVELGVVRGVKIENTGKVVIQLTPTYSGCPAMKLITDDVVAKLTAKGIHKVVVELVTSPAWTTDWITEGAKEKLRAYGIAPPEKTSVDKGLLSGAPKIVKCPHCHSENTVMVSQFGSTACKALYKCADCLEPFDYFKCI